MTDDNIMKLVWLIVAGGIAYLWWGKREDKKTLDRHTMEITTLQSTSVTEEKVRDIIIESIALALTPVTGSLNEIKDLVVANTVITKGLQSRADYEDGYRQAKKDLEEE